MHLNYTNGCTCTSLTVDGEETIDMNINDFKNVIKKICHLTIYDGMNKLIFDFMVDMLSPYYIDPKIIESQTECQDIKLYEINIDDIVLSYCEVFYEDMIFINHKLWNKNINDEILFIVDKLIDLTDDICPLQTFFCKVLEKYGTMEDCYPYHCDCCGDWVYSYDFFLN